MLSIEGEHTLRDEKTYSTCVSINVYIVRLRV